MDKKRNWCCPDLILGPSGQKEKTLTLYNVVDLFRLGVRTRLIHVNGITLICMYVSFHTYSNLLTSLTLNMPTQLLDSIPI